MAVRKTAETGSMPQELAGLANGARWRRVDFHLHSPGVDSFACPHGLDLLSQSARDQIASAYAERLSATGIEIAAITDYNGIRTGWYEVIRSAAASRGVLVLPGAELSISSGKGVHILAIFAEGTDPNEINEFIRSLDRSVRPLFSDDRSHVELDPKENLHDTLKDVKGRFGCLLIPAHPRGAKGVIESLGAKRSAELFKEVGFDAIEHGGSKTLEQLRSPGILSQDSLTNLALVEFSDPKRLEDIGAKTLSGGQARGTWLKLSATDLDALRLALHDPMTRLSLAPPKEASHARILGMEVEGSGFLRNMRIAWNDDLNVLIGGRGAGKSAVLETLRYGMDIAPYSDPTYRKGLVSHAMGSGGMVTLVVERPGSPGGRRYRIRRVLDQPPEVEDVSTGDTLRIRPSEVFGPSAEPLILLQQEIQAVSRDDAFRLRLLDVLIGERAALAAREVRRIQEALRTNARALLEAVRRLEKRHEYEERLRTIENEIDFFESQGVADKLQTHAALTADRTVLDQALRRVGDLGRRWAQDGQSLVSSLRSSNNSLSSGKSNRADLLLEAAGMVERLRETLGALVAQGEAAFADAGIALDSIENRWVEALRPLEEELRRLQQELQTESLDPRRLLDLVRERTGLEPLLTDLAATEKELVRLREQRVKLLRDLRLRRREEHVLRREKCDEVNDRLKDRLRLTVEFMGHKTEYRQTLAGLLKGSGVTGDALDRLITPDATDGAALTQAAREGEGAVQQGFGLSQGMSQKLVKWLTDNEDRLLEIEAVTPGDTVRMELIVDGQGRPLDRLSLGQRATAVLLLLFALEGRILILDQPEEDLDNRFVYEDIVNLLREEKGISRPNRRRQVIGATHNPNIPVLGDAEEVLVLEASEGASSILTRASIDAADVRERIRTLLEGGEQAFRRRAEKYGGIT